MRRCAPRSGSIPVTRLGATRRIRCGKAAHAPIELILSESFQSLAEYRDAVSESLLARQGFPISLFDEAD